MKKIYISGKMTGVKDFNYPAFNAAEENLIEAGYETFNPANIKSEADWEWKDYMKVCIKAIPDCTHIYMLKDWESSRGANIELLLAYTLGLEIMFEE